MTHRYRTCGFALDSAIELPGLAAGSPDAAPDITIRAGAVPDALDAPLRRTASYEHDGRRAIWRLAGVARYLVDDGGRSIVVDPAPGADPASVALFALRPVLALAGVMRGEWMLGGAAVERGGRVFAFVGASASGKSAAAALLVRRGGYTLVADSLLRVTFDAAGTPVAHPQAGALILWPDVLQRIGVEADACAPARPGIAPRLWPAPVATAPLPLARVALLREQRGDDLALFSPDPRIGRRAFEMVLRHVAGETWAEALGPRAGLFGWGTSLAARTRIERLELPWGWDQLDRLSDSLDAWCSKP